PNLEDSAPRSPLRGTGSGGQPTVEAKARRPHDQRTSNARIPGRTRKFSLGRSSVNGTFSSLLPTGIFANFQCFCLPMATTEQAGGPACPGSFRYTTIRFVKTTESLGARISCAHFYIPILVKLAAISCLAVAKPSAPVAFGPNAADENFSLTFVAQVK